MRYCSSCNEPNNPICAMNMFAKTTEAGNCYTRCKNCLGASNCITTECRDKPCRKYACYGPSCTQFGNTAIKGDDPKYCPTCKVGFREMQQKRIWNQVRVASSMFTMNRVAVAVFHNDANAWGKDKVPALNWNQSSDRFQPHKTLLTSIIPTKGNSTKRTKTACRPGAMNPGGTGVDVKHNSYDRYLARKKGYLLTKPAVEVDPPMMGNKCRTYNIINECVKCVDPSCSEPDAPCAEVKLPCNPCGDCCPRPDTDFRVEEPPVFCGKQTWGDYKWIKNQNSIEICDFGTDKPFTGVDTPFDASFACHNNCENYIKLPCSGNHGTGKYTLTDDMTFNENWNMCIDDGAMLIIDNSHTLTNKGVIYNAGIIYIKCDGKLNNDCTIVNCGNIVLEDCCDDIDIVGLDNTKEESKVYGVIGSIQNCNRVSNLNGGLMQPCPPCGSTCESCNNCYSKCNCHPQD